ncbi:hypothetical protein JAAARDRAFT_210702 [Jaapia argillacea MUCL 33604]|uniref:RecF/RecN/SMC N-terminal domain-containing protein n=1 Tax=Jaapia argillacea MUCL 33604 TaxID=933084 RepID=A0A067PP50_9AGAM|nr:hypothetical protein JAAARDRAFT_210702 [Jaapia argillacea MUCL 33604]
MPLTHLELYNFKSYKGHQNIGPFTSFTSVIGPNGAGKSNLMDAISFVLGVKSRELRSSQLRDLVYRGRRIPRGGGEGGVDASYVTSDGSGPIEPDAEAEVEAEEEGEDGRQGEEKKAWVMAVFVDKDGKEWKFKRTTSTSGTSSYTLNGVATSYTAYTAFLAKHSILVRARNFLVFQGDVELVASQSPRALTRLIEQISGSLELKPLYESHLASLNSATERANENFGKRRGVNGEIRVFREQKKEVEEFEGVVAKRDELTLRRHLHTLFHIEDSLDTATHTIRTLATSLPPLLSTLKEKEETLEEKRREEARVRGVFVKKERGVKKSERALEGKKPSLITLTTQITHSTGKLRRAQTNKEQLLAEVEKFERALEERRKELGGVRKDAEEAQEKARKASAHNVSLSEESLEEKSASQKHAITERQALSTLSLQMKADKRGLAQIKDKYEQFEERKKKLSEESASVGERRVELEAKVRDYQGELEKTRQELDNQTSERNRVNQLTTELNEKLQDVLNKILQAVPIGRRPLASVCCPINLDFDHLVHKACEEDVVADLCEMSHEDLLPPSLDTEIPFSHTSPSTTPPPPLNA